MKLNLDEIEKALGELEDHKNQRHFHNNAPEWLRLLVERVRKLEKVVSIIKDNPFTISSWVDNELAVELGIAMLELENKESTT